MHSTPQPPSAAREHFADAERILAALPLVKRRADRDRHVQVALVHATLAVAAGTLGEWQATTRPEDAGPAGAARGGHERMTKF
jgi:hypothetical protein